MDDELPYSPTLKKAMAAISAILEAYDIAGMVVLHTPGNSEYMLKINPSYSCAKFEGDNIRIRAKAVDFGGDTAKRQKVIADTSNMFNLITETAGRNTMQLIQLSEMLDKIVGAEHTPGIHTPGK